MFEFFLGQKFDSQRLAEIESLLRDRAGASELTVESGFKNLAHARAFFDLFSAWPPYIRDDFGQTLLAASTMLRFPRFQLLLFIDRRVAGYVSTVPVFLDPDCKQLPDEGYTWAIKSSLRPSFRKPNTLCALAAVLDPRFKGRGLSQALVETLKLLTVSEGLPRLVAPVRPTEKWRYPEEDMAEYVTRSNGQGMPQDPWLRSHVQGGGVVRNVCRASIVVQASKARWERWLNAELRPGENVVMGGLTPVRFEKGTGIYTEPNVWVDYDLRSGPRTSRVDQPQSHGVQSWQ